MMRFFEWLEHFLEKYGLVTILIFEAVLLLCALISVLVFIIKVASWRALAWFGFAGLIIILAVLTYGIVDEFRQIKKLQ